MSKHFLFITIFFLIAFFEKTSSQQSSAPHKTFDIPCMSCHTAESWKALRENISFEHKRTGYILIGEHQNVKCAQCHDKFSMKISRIPCSTCHKDQHKGEFGNQCNDCHSPLGWRSPSEQIAKHQLTRFPLLGPHLLIDCKACHRNQQAHEFTNTPTECIACHQKQYTEVVTPNHLSNHFDTNCLLCHDQSGNGWKGSFMHPIVEFMQTTAHNSLQCNQCHTTGYEGAPTACFGCHEKDYAAAKQPNHQSVKFSRDCIDCHQPTKWKPASFSHSSTRFPLEGTHATTDCERCHATQFAGTPMDCWSCHNKEYASVKFPDHSAGQFDHDCTACHGMQAWQPAKFEHDLTKFPLTGKHKSTDCQRCHINGNFKNMPLECQGCHEQNYRNTTQPNHQLVRFPMQCQDCHSTQAWQPVIAMPHTIDHDKTRFQLIGKHTSVLCEKCHVNMIFKGTATDCFPCHQQSFSSTKNPDHVAGTFNHDCLQCHTMNGWKPATLDHNKTRFPLTDKHATTLCADCHSSGQYAGTPTDCYACHQHDFTRVTNPNHISGNFDHDCTKCHTTKGWKPATIDHNKTRFPLTGAHTSKRCEQCHRNGQYTNTPITCYDCHQNDFSNVATPDHVKGQFDHDCFACHTTSVWKPSTFQHAQTKFPLTGKHLIALCERCHINGQFKNLPMECYACHQSDFSSVKSPDHSINQFPHDCAQCHTTSSWKPSSFDHTATLFPLIGAHRTIDCKQCHANGNYAQTASDCWSCHQSKFQTVQQPNHVSGQFNHDCTFCHGMTSWKPTALDHGKTRFPLNGKHSVTACERCHTNGEYGKALPIECYGCHQGDFTQVKTPDHVSGQFDHDCTKCHSTSIWKPSTFNHASTPFPLTGKHLSTACADCHVNGNYKITYTDCYQCHQPDFQRAQTPSHVAGQFNHDCTKCHTTTAWTPSTFNHAATKFPLIGKHLTTDCQRCHTNGDYNITYSDCYRCHQMDFNRVTEPNHVSGAFDHDCSKCHSSNSWKPANFDHATTKFPLTGKHVSTVCSQCHTNGNYKLVYTDCYQCHQPDYQRVQTPNHVTGQFDHDCARCHNTTAFKPAVFDHGTTAFPLSGRHITTECSKCHVNGNYNLTYNSCFDCHQDTYISVTQPNHVAGKFDHDCAKCHSSNAWKPAQFNHATTSFPLTGAHVATSCENCHVNGNYNLTYTDCWQCHEPVFNQSKNPPHASGQLPHDCLQCHTTTAWRPSSFNHAATPFPLQGAHATTPCQNCHVHGNYNLTFTDCWQCHATNFTNSTNPNHALNNFPHDCTQCHSVNAWRPSTFNHANTNFPLQGAHTPLQCGQCHVNGNYQLTYTQCYQCHQSTFNGAQNPPHQSNQLPHDCTQCHTQSVWRPSTFNHANTNFPLVGAHPATPCIGCHVGGNYNLTYTNCWQCHTNTFNQAQNPNHASNQLPHDCLQCHTQSVWRPSTFNHANTNFPIVGAHQSQPCSACHVGGNYNVTYTDCWQCHASTFNQAQNPNHVSNQFPHDCLSCHDQNGWRPSTFNHANTNFPLQGAHQSQPCNACHTNGNYNLAYVDCYQCHQTNFNQAQNPNHVSNQFSHTCTQCHSQNAWSPSTFNHANTNFSLQGAHTSLACNRCHTNGNYQLTYTNCYQCHASKFNGATTPANHPTLNLSHNCETCHNQTSWNPASLFRTFHNQNYPTAFPMYTGAKHKYPDKWSNCNQCHTANNVNAFCCTQACHTNQNELNNKHQGKPGYVYNCTSCVNCHPDGRE